MATTLSIANTEAISCCDDVVDSIDTGAGTAQLVIYDGTPPALVDTALSGNTVLAELALSNPAFGAAADAAPGATATANAISDDTSANATGTATFFRLLDRNGTPRVQGSVGTSGEALNLNTTSIVAGATVSVTSLTVTMPEG
jgi:hypothetical protein